MVGVEDAAGLLDVVAVGVVEALLRVMLEY